MRRILASLVLAAFAWLSPLGMAQATGDRIDFYFADWHKSTPRTTHGRSASGTFLPAATRRTQPKKQPFSLSQFLHLRHPGALRLLPRQRALRDNRRSTSSTPVTVPPRPQDRPSIFTATSRS